MTRNYLCCYLQRKRTGFVTAELALSSESCSKLRHQLSQPRNKKRPTNCLLAGLEGLRPRLSTKTSQRRWIRLWPRGCSNATGEAWQRLVQMVHVRKFDKRTIVNDASSQNLPRHPANDICIGPANIFAMLKRPAGRRIRGNRTPTRWIAPAGRLDTIHRFQDPATVLCELGSRRRGISFALKTESCRDEGQSGKHRCRKYFVHFHSPKKRGVGLKAVKWPSLPAEAYEFVICYSVGESVGIATGFLIASIHNVGLVSLTHSHCPMEFLNKILNRSPGLGEGWCESDRLWTTVRFASPGWWATACRQGIDRNRRADRKIRRTLLAEPPIEDGTGPERRVLVSRLHGTDHAGHPIPRRRRGANGPKPWWILSLSKRSRRTHPKDATGETIGERVKDGQTVAGTSQVRSRIRENSIVPVFRFGCCPSGIAPPLDPAALR